jgi:superfamily II DNA or RNA helicase
MFRLQSCWSGDPGDRLYDWGIVDHPERNQTLAWAAHALMEAGKRVLVIVKQVKHAANLASLIPGAVQVDGTTAERSAQVPQVLTELERGTIRCVVGTSVIGEGVDVPAADALVYAAGGRSKVKVVQDFFRVLTTAGGKTEGLVIDCADNHHERLVEAAAHRLELYRRSFDSTVLESYELPGWVSRAVAGT